MNQHGQYTSPALFVELTLVAELNPEGWLMLDEKAHINLTKALMVSGKHVSDKLPPSAEAVITMDGEWVIAVAETPCRIMELSYYAQGLW